MIRTDVRVTVDRDAAGGVDRGTRRALMDAATAGFNESQERVAAQSTDTGQLLRSGVPPQQLNDGSVVWGYAADYARDVEEGTPPHIAPIEAIRGWARRVLGDESLAGAVWRKIAREGTDAQPFVKPGIDTMRAALRSRGIGAYIEEEL